MIPKISVGKHVLFISSTGTIKVHLLAIDTALICHQHVTNISDNSLWRCSQGGAKKRLVLMRDVSYR